MRAYYDKNRYEGYLLFNDNYESQSILTVRLNGEDIQDLAYIACELYAEAFGKKYKGRDEE